ncbi:MAG TPA: MBL fold metallo-hydrolase [Afifellaceae bacterium]|nr:MBL fold metallo-hydrolase [Afifellaceae bacterium]
MNASVQLSAEPELRPLATGVHAWIGAGGDSNAGVIDTPDGLIVIDAQQHAGLARRFRDALDAAYGKPVRALINTHYHFDHVAGNSIFAAGIPIIAHEITRRRLEARLGTDGPPPWTVTDMETMAGMFYGENIGDLVPKTDPAWSWFEQRFEPADYDRLEIVPPTETFADRFAFHLPDGAIELDYFGPAHSDGDIVVQIPHAGVVFLSDLFFYGRFPWLGDCDLDGWIGALDIMLQRNFDVIVPGHGNVGSPADLAWFRDLLSALRRAVDNAIAGGSTEEAACAEVQLPDYAHLSRYDEWMRFNVRSAYRARGGST